MLTESSHILLFGCIHCTVTPEIPSSVKISLIQPVFPDYLSLSYGYENRVLPDEEIARNEPKRRGLSIGRRE